MKKSIAFLLVGLISGLSLGWWLYRPGAPKIEPPAPAIRQSDGSLILERKPDPSAKAPAEIPKGAHLERVERVVIQPRPTPVQDDNSGARDGANTRTTTICRPAEVDLSLLKMRDKTERVVASSPDGKIVGGVDIPVAPIAASPQITRWSVSALYGYDVTRARAVWGAGLSYSRGPFVVTTGAIGSTAFVGAGLKF
jgi:hypothetical protein